MTIQTRFVLLVLLQQPEREMHGEEIAGRLHLSADVVAAILARLVDAGWVTQRPASAETETAREPRLYHRLTDTGATSARQVLASGLTQYFTDLARRLGLDLHMITQ